MINELVVKLLPKRLYLVLDDIFSRFQGIINTMIFKGNKYKCPFCHQSFSKFMPVGYKHDILTKMQVIGGGYRPNGLCPSCKSIDRERLTYIFLEKNHLIEQDIRLLHVAPEKNLQKAIQQKNIDYYPADLESPRAKIKMNIEKIDFPDEYFDSIICNHVLEHVPNDLKAMREFYRVLKKGGWAILQVPYSPLLDVSLEDDTVVGREQRKKVFGQDNHVRMYGLDYSDRLRSAGFSVSLEGVGNEQEELFALNPAEKLFFCKKND
jgi:SAM-dependent methyltransferase